MAQNGSATAEATPKTERPSRPNPALKRLEKLVGTWDITGRTLDSKEDNVSGRVTIAWMPGGFFLEQRGEMEMLGLKAQSLEILGYDPEADSFPSWVYSSMDGVPIPYFWDVQGNDVTHWTKGSTYTGTFSKDGNTLTGGWRQNKDDEGNAGGNYDAVMTRVK